MVLYRIAIDMIVVMVIGFTRLYIALLKPVKIVVGMMRTHQESVILGRHAQHVDGLMLLLVIIIKMEEPVFVNVGILSIILGVTMISLLVVMLRVHLDRLSVVQEKRDVLK
jgi:hypothetical protein